MHCYRDRTYCPFLECKDKKCDRKADDVVRESAEKVGELICLFVNKPECFKEKK